MRKFIKSVASTLLVGSRLLRVCQCKSFSPVSFDGSKVFTSIAQSKEHTTQAIIDWLEKSLATKSSLPIFALHGKNIKVLKEPDEFYQTLKSRAANSKRRIVLSSLYLGTGELEQKLVDTIYRRSVEMTELSKDFEVTILLEHTRGSRGIKNSRTMLLPLIQDFPNYAKVHLYHTPKLRGILRALIPERFNETVSAMHMKVYIFDDTLVMSGANLSNDYFTNRQDRCIVFEECKDLCDYFHNLVKTVSSFSLQLCQDDTTTMQEDFPEHPYLGNKHRFLNAAKKNMDEFFRTVNYRSLLNLDSLKCVIAGKNYSATELELNSDEKFDKKEKQNVKNRSNSQDNSLKDCLKPDTFFIPLVQIYPLDIRDDEHVTSNIFNFAPLESNIFLATAYFNLTSTYWNNILKSSCNNIDVVMAHPEANGFFKAAGLAGGIPHAYTLIAKQCYNDIVRFKQQHRIRFWEYLRPSWTFHGKGFWAQIEDSLVPYITMIGSSNFGNRSVYRDLEAQALIITLNEDLSKELIEEKNNIMDYSHRVHTSTYKDSNRQIPFWVYLIRTLMRTFF